MTKIIWTVELLKALATLRAQGHPTDTCAFHLGISHTVVGAKLKELGWNQRMNQGRRNGQRALVEPPFDRTTYNRTYHRRKTNGAQ